MGIWVTSSGQPLPFPLRLAADLFEIGGRDGEVGWDNAKRLHDEYIAQWSVLDWNELNAADQELMRELVRHYIPQIGERCSRLGYAEESDLRKIFDKIWVDICGQ